jgi:hypothetical protein
MNDDSGPVPEDTRHIVRVLAEDTSRKNRLKDSLWVRLSTQVHTLGTNCSRVWCSSSTKLGKIRVVPRSIRLAETILVSHIQHRRVINRVPELRDEAVCQSLLDFGMIAQIRNELDRSLHDHCLVILLHFSL